MSRSTINQKGLRILGRRIEGEHRKLTKETTHRESAFGSVTVWRLRFSHVRSRAEAATMLIFNSSLATRLPRLIAESRPSV